MTKIDDKLLDHLSKLAKLEFITDEERSQIKTDLNRMLAFMDKLNELDTDNIEPLKYVNEDANPLRDDIPKIDITQEEALKNAPDKDSDYFKVPKIIEQ
jgi:aspartyl-tRNA(Asn)/glutamyl-tRNA(Gln) amidotransferase subunit C